MLPFEPRLFLFYVKQHQKYCYGYYFINVFKFSSSSTTNSFSVFRTAPKDRFLPILHVHRFRLSGSSCNFLWFISMKPPSLSLVFTLVFIHTISLFHFVIHLGIHIIKLVINFVLCMAIGSAFVYFQTIGDE